jgi:signal transduction histidine kinase
MHGRIISVGDGKYAVSVTDDPIQTGCYLVSYMDVTQILAFTTRINRVLLVIILVAILISVILSRHFAKSFAAPVQELSAFACEIGEGNLIPKEFAFRDIEFAGLADSMNHMASELQAAKQKQETLFQNVSHELRTPLTSIRGNAEGIVYGVMEPQTAARVILAESDKLGGMVEDILYLSRIGKTVPDTEAEPIDLREVLSLCVSEQRADAEGRGIDFRFDFDEDPVLLSIREQDALRMFGNLISNAIRYAGTAVTLVCRTDHDKVFVSVSDDGEGISSEDLPHIFERFYKGKGGRHGIGLAIAQSVAEMYHGELTARNDGGAVFEVIF